MRSVTAAEAPALVGPSPLGWFAVAGNERAITCVTIGCPTEGDARNRLLQAIGDHQTSISSLVRDAADEIARYLAGEPVDLNRLPVESGVRTPFQQRVVAALRKVGYGETLSYAELADRAGNPNAARAVGTVMSSNRIPLLIPCHRVIGARGRLGGFSAPSGIELKRALLAMESGCPDSLFEPTIH